MEHTYLRYECADSFGLVVAAASSKAPPSNSILSFVNQESSRQHSSSASSVLLTTAGSHCVGYNLRTGLPVLKFGHREQLSGGVGTGRALNSDEVVCLDTMVQGDSSSRDNLTYMVATGWVDGAVRVFTIFQADFESSHEMAHSLLIDKHVDNDVIQREPLVLNGHNKSPVRTVTFDKGPKSSSLLASGASDGSVVLWDVVAERGLFRFLGHRGGITDIKFVHAEKGSSFLVTTCLDGLVKVWDIEGQCCVQTIANHRGEVLGADLLRLADKKGDTARWRLVTGCNDGQIRVWMVTKSKPENEIVATDHVSSNIKDAPESPDDLCTFMGFLAPPPLVSTSFEKISSVHSHSSGRFVGVLRSNSKNIDVYVIRNTEEALKKRHRRLKRRNEKNKKKLGVEDDEKKSGQKRGILDSPELNVEDEEDQQNDFSTEDEALDPNELKASDEFEYILTLRASHKIRDFIFVSHKAKGELALIICALVTNSFETYAIKRHKSDKQDSGFVAEKSAVMNVEGHPTGIRAVALSSDDKLACTVSKNVTKVWNMNTRQCIQSISPSITNKNKKATFYGLCAVFLPGDIYVAVGTREGHILLLDLNTGDVACSEVDAHSAAVWSIDVRRSTARGLFVSLMSGSADKSVKFWDVELSEDGHAPILTHSRTLQMADDVVAARFSHSIDASKRMIFVPSLDCTIKVFFDDTLKLFLSLYGHKLPALAVDSSDDDTLLASSGADKAIKIWGLDFGDTHRTLHGHDDSVTDLRFVRRTHNFFTASKDGTLRYWDGDRFEQILLLAGHFAEVNSLAISRTGAFVISAGMDRQVRVWERTKDIVFLAEERERELEHLFDKVNDHGDGTTEQILNRATDNAEDKIDDLEEPQTEAAVKRSTLSVAAGDRLLEGIERADQELEELSSFRKSHGSDKQRQSNPMLLNMEPPHYILWILKSIKSSELEQSLLLLPLNYVERLLYYCTILLKQGRGVEVCARVTVFMIEIYQKQIIAHRSMVALLRELRRLVRLRLTESRDTVGYNLAAMRVIARSAQENNSSLFDDNFLQSKNIWAGLGLGSDVAAALEGRSRKR